VWETLNVAYQIDKGQFIDWLKQRIDAELPRAASRG
jgi:hypothetical protein